jgi:hypothetical protein
VDNSKWHGFAQSLVRCRNDPENRLPRQSPEKLDRSKLREDFVRIVLAGHGFGLHSGALAAKELGGTLTAFSEGAGRGSEFTLEIPVAKKTLLARRSA